jgi:hypothetical protein
VPSRRSRSAARTATPARHPRHTGKPYLFRGLITCGVCDRKMVGNPNHGRLYYRCTASRDFVRRRQISHPPALYLREDAIIRPVDEGACIR